jgi:ABC-type uncharacterized transport system permease subunit
MLRLEMRPQASPVWSIASPLLALAITVVLGATLFIALGKDPVRGLQMFFWEPIKSSYALGELMVKATPLLLIALGLAVCFRSNVWNIGAEGQFVVGALAAGWVALQAGPPDAGVVALIDIGLLTLIHEQIGIVLPVARMVGLQPLGPAAEIGEPPQHVAGLVAQSLAGAQFRTSLQH